MHSSRKLRELEEAPAQDALESLAAGVAHEARNQIFALSSTLEALEARFTGEVEELPYFTIMREELARLTRLMGHLAELGRPIAPLLGLGRVDEAVLDAISRAQALAEQTGVTLVFESREARARFDHEHLTRALVRLIEHAFRRSPGGSSLALSLETAGTDVTLALCDRGPRLERAQLARFFEPFFSPGRGPRGLELALARRSILDQGGRVHVENGELTGVCVCVALPVASAG